MKIFIQIALRNLVRNKIRTLMTVMGVGMGIGVFISLSSISKSIEAQVQDVIKGYHFDITILSKGSASPFSSKIDANQAQRLLAIKGISSVSSLIIGKRGTKWNPYFFIIGAASEGRVISQINIIEGRPFTTGKNELIIGELLAKKLGLAPNDILAISREASYKITGIFRFGGRILDNGVILSIKQAQEILDQKDQINLLIAYPDGQEKTDQLVATINKSFPKLTAQEGDDFIGRMHIFRTLTAFFSAVSFISLASCCFFVINTLLMAITERIKEIGILMAIGWDRKMIMMTIAFEALMVCFLGYIAGGMLGTFFLRILNHRNFFPLIGSIPVFPAMDILFLAFSISILLGILSAIYPGIIATRMLPAKALMHE